MAKGLYANINARKKAGTSRSKTKSTISKKAYADMKAGFPKKMAEGGSATTLTKRQETALARHKEHHTGKHMAEMRRLMKKGSSFTEAHKKAMKKVGA
jgi:hypothetical protein